jgi:hypothetical protein
MAAGVDELLDRIFKGSVSHSLLEIFLASISIKNLSFLKADFRHLYAISVRKKNR